ncbi:MAG TPA: TetR/AcrR family transcriptional regulator [Solirubrobacterales bacterium]|nr:TetR/AcrR family transcriptional regulator [Solirubrobacterales bacterium]
MNKGHEKAERILRGLAEVVCEHGRAQLTVDLILQRANVSRSAFYERFDNIEDATRSAMEMASERLGSAIATAAPDEKPWADRMEAVMSALVTAVVEEPALASLCLAHGYLAPDPRNQFHPALLDILVEVLQSGEGEIPTSRPPLTEEFIACGILSVIAEQLRQGEVNGLEDLTGELTELALLTLPSHAEDVPVH